MKPFGVREPVGEVRHALVMIAHSENRPRWRNERSQAKVNVRPLSSLSCLMKATKSQKNSSGTEVETLFPSMSCAGRTSRPARRDPVLTGKSFQNHWRMFFCFFCIAVSSYLYLLFALVSRFSAVTGALASTVILPFGSRKSFSHPVIILSYSRPRTIL